MKLIGGWGGGGGVTFFFSLSLFFLPSDTCRMLWVLPERGFPTAGLIPDRLAGSAPGRGGLGGGAPISVLVRGFHVRDG